MIKEARFLVQYVQSFPDCQSGDINDYSTLAYRVLRTGEHNIFWLFDSLQGHVSKLIVYWPFLGIYIYINMYIYTRTVNNLTCTF